MDREEIIVSGASSPIGYFLLPRLIESHSRVIALSRLSSERRAHLSLYPGNINLSKYITWYQIDSMAGHIENIDTNASILIHLAPLWVMPNVISSLTKHNLTRIIAFGSTSLFTKTYSENQHEQDIVSQLKFGEEWLKQYCSENNIAWTLFRPTLVYGLGRDKSLTTIYRFIKRFGFIPMIGPGAGLRQPVHADDLAIACLSVLKNTNAYNKAYNLAGGETLSFRDMAQAVAEAAGTKLRVLRIPKSLVRIALSIAKIVPSYRHLNAEMLIRTEQNLAFDINDAVRDFGYAPRPFQGNIYVSDRH